MIASVPSKGIVNPFRIASGGTADSGTVPQDTVTLGSTEAPEAASHSRWARLGLASMAGLSLFGALGGVALAAPAAPPAATTSTSTKQDVSTSQASGFVGNNSLNVSLSENNGQVGVSGFMGSGFVNLNETNSAGGGYISGTISTPRGIIDVNVQVSNDGGGGKSYNGFLGNSFVSLHESRNGGGAWITGEVGNKSYNVTRQDSANGSEFSGDVSGFGGDFGWINVGVNGNAPTDAIVPLFALTR